MEILNLYSVWDKEGKRYDTPFLAFSDLFAKRKFIMFANDENSIFTKFKNAFELHKIGSFNVITGDLSACNDIIITGLQIIEGEN